jgi:hypothetical protein
MTRRRGIRREHRDLAVLHPPRGAGILALHAGTGPSLLDVARLIHHQDPIRAAQMADDITAQVIADRIGVPPGRR